MKRITKHQEVVGGFSLIEMLVVIMVFSVLVLLATQAVFLTLRSVKKTQNLVVVRQNLDHAIGTMERKIRNAESIDCGVTNDVLNPNIKLNFDVDDGGTVSTTQIECVGVGGSTSGITETQHWNTAAYITTDIVSDKISITSCRFECDQNDSGPTEEAPPKVTIDITAGHEGSTGIERVEVSSRTQVYVRSYGGE